MCLDVDTTSESGSTDSCMSDSSALSKGSSGEEGNAGGTGTQRYSRRGKLQRLQSDL